MAEGEGSRDTPVDHLRRNSIIGVAAVAIVAATLYAIASASRSRGEWVQHSRDVTRIAREVSGLALDRETALRGFLLSGDSANLEPYIRAEPGLVARLDSLRTLTSDNPAQQAQVRGIDSAVALWDTVFARPALALGPARVARVDGLAPLAGKLLFDGVRGSIASFIAGEERLYLGRLRDARRTNAVLQLAILAELAALLVGFLVAMRRATVRTSTIMSHERTLQHQNAALEEQMRLLTQQTVELREQSEQLQNQAVELETQTEELQQHEAALEAALDSTRLSEERFRALVDSMHDIVYTLDLRGTVTGIYGRGRREGIDLASTFAPITGSAANGAAGAPSSDTPHLDAARRALQGEVVYYDWRVEHPEGGDRFFTSVLSPHRDADGAIAGVVGIAREVSEQRRMDAKLESTTAQLRQSQKLEAVGQLAGGVAHDFNNLLTVILSETALLRDDIGPNDPRIESLESIQNAGNRAAELTRHLLAFSRRQVLRPHPLDLNATVGDIERILRRLISTNIAFRTRLDPHLGTILADPGQIEQVVLNLALNARDAMPTGGILMIETANVELDDDYARRHAGTMPGPHVMLAVSDTGIGMSADVQARIFEPFFTTKEPGRGTGLGLSTVYGIVEQTGGRVWVYSEPEKGSTFKLYFPRVDAAASKKRVSGGHRLGTRGGSETILVVDDDAAVRRVICRTLRTSGYTVIEAGDGASALETILGGKQHIDLIVGSPGTELEFAL